MGDVWLVLCAAAAMLSLCPVMKRLDAAIEAQLERMDDEAWDGGQEPERDGTGD